MADNTPLKLDGGRIKQFAAGDTLPIGSMPPELRSMVEIGYLNDLNKELVLLSLSEPHSNYPIFEIR